MLYEMSNIKRNRPIVRRRSEQKKYFLGVCAIFHSEQSFIKEWIDFHLKQGVERFYLYDNEINPIYTQILEPYINRDQVVYCKWPDDPKQPDWTQRKAYGHCLNNYGKECEWIGFFDIDEFLFPERTLTNAGSVVELLRHFDDRVSQIMVVRYNYGNYWHDAPPPVGGVVQNYLTRDRTFSDVKSLVRTDRVKLNRVPESVHKYNSIISYGVSLNGEYSPLPLRINHYLTKSTKEFNDRNTLWRKKRETRLFNPPDMRRFDKTLQPEAFNQVYDNSAASIML